jgi:hypothetical protein
MQLNYGFKKFMMLFSRTVRFIVEYVEGAEVEVLKGATSLLEEPHHWVVEVHGDHLLDPVLDCFAKAKRPVDVRPPQPHWLLGPESRTIKTSWVTTKATTSR